MTEQKTIPIVEAGQLVPEAGMLILGYMLHPNCERSAQQFTRVLVEETIAKANDPSYQPSAILEKVVDVKVFLHLMLTGHLAQRICANHARTGEPYYKKALFLVSELNATNKTLSGKSIPSSVSTIHENFLKYRAVMHFWAASYYHYPQDDGTILTGVEAITEMLISSSFLGHFLSIAKQFEEMLAEAKPAAHVWSASEPASEIWDWNQFPKMRLKLESPKALEALKSYRSPNKS
ncbi:hypothetical protein [Celeribacter halophilus]|uniref:hypothetical protein n=1 Tax=Celeribacter halophilus TaxID=576117 RepID=UPI003A939153